MNPKATAKAVAVQPFIKRAVGGVKHRRCAALATDQISDRPAAAEAELQPAQTARNKNGGGERRNLEPEPSRAGLVWRLPANKNGGRDWD
jgi:hypothetical protein